MWFGFQSYTILTKLKQIQAKPNLTQSKRNSVDAKCDRGPKLHSAR